MMLCILQGGILVSNGVIHILDAVLIPPEDEEEECGKRGCD
jgi:uncharacterized surface protein with fasciclin (FAS1) repeats